MQHINTSLDYYLLPFFQKEGMSLQRLDNHIALCQGNSGNKLAIIIRYLSRRDYRKLKSLKKEGYKLVYFMDDDLLDKQVLTTSALPSAYAKKLKAQATNHRRFLQKYCDELWVSTNYLVDKYQAKYQNWTVRQIPIRTAAKLQSNKQAVWVCYHGSAAHQLEFEWLQSLVGKLQQQTEQTWFEVFGDNAVLKQFRHVERVQVLHPMSWASYLDYTQSVQRDIGLVPLLPDPFNKARSICKFFDITRMGAVGIYSNVSPYTEFIEDGVDGFLVDNDEELWIEKINYLIQNPEVRKQMADNAQLRIQGMMEQDAIKE